MKCTALLVSALAALSTATPLASPHEESVTVDIRSVDNAPAAEYSVASWSNPKRSKRSIDNASAAEYSVASWSGNPKRTKRAGSDLTGADIDDVCAKLTGPAEDLNGIPIAALIVLCDVLVN